MEKRTKEIVSTIQMLLAGAFDNGAEYYFLSKLGADLGPLRNEIESLTRSKLRKFLEIELGVRVSPASESNTALVMRPDALASILAAVPDLPSFRQVGHADSTPQRQASNGLWTEPALIPQYRNGVWATFTSPLDPDKTRYLSPATCSFADVATGEAVPGGMLEVPRNLLCAEDDLDKLKFVENSIRVWAIDKGVDPDTLKTRERKSESPKQNPVYPWPSTNIIQSILTDSARYKSYKEAIDHLNEVRERFTCKKLERGEIREDYDFLWIHNFALSEEQQRKGERGNYARIYIEHIGARWHVRAETVQGHDDWRPPEPVGGWQNKDHPNWGIRTLRKLKQGPIFFDSEDDAQAEMNWLVDTFPKVMRLSNSKIACMVYKRVPGGKGVAFDKVDIRLGYDQTDRPYLYLNWKFSEKQRTPRLPFPTSQEHPQKAVDGVVRSMFSAETDIEHKVARHAAQEILNWEGRGKYKANAATHSNQLYHYTSLEAFDAIVEHGQVWLTDLRYMNDMSEIFHGHSVLGAFFMQYAAALSEVDGQPDKQRMDLIAMVDQLIAAKPINDTIYGLCLTDNFEVTAQWLSYGNGSSGVALGFDRDALADAGAFGGLGLRRILYHPDRKTDIIHNVVKSVLADTSLINADANELASALASVLRSMCVIFKHDSFYTEKEWRLIKRDDGDLDKWPIKQRRKGDPKSGFLATYIAMDFERHLAVHIRDILRSIYIAPGSHQEERSRSVRGTLRRLKLENVEVILSTIPLSAF
jgi:hypothetical protein